MEFRHIKMLRTYSSQNIVRFLYIAVWFFNKKQTCQQIKKKKPSLKHFNYFDKSDKTYGKGAVIRWGIMREDAEAISSGSSLDLALGVEDAQRQDCRDIRTRIRKNNLNSPCHCRSTKSWRYRCFCRCRTCWSFLCRELGIDIDNLIISQPDHGEQALEITDNLIRSGAIDIVVIYSSSINTEIRDWREMGDSKMGLHARLMSQALRKLTGTISKTNCTVIFINNWKK